MIPSGDNFKVCAIDSEGNFVRILTYLGHAHYTRCEFSVVTRALKRCSLSYLTRACRRRRLGGCLARTRLHTTRLGALFTEKTTAFTLILNPLAKHSTHRVLFIHAVARRSARLRRRLGGYLTRACLGGSYLTRACGRGP